MGMTLNLEKVKNTVSSNEISLVSPQNFIPDAFLFQRLWDIMHWSKQSVFSNCMQEISWDKNEYLNMA